MRNLKKKQVEYVILVNSAPSPSNKTQTQQPNNISGKKHNQTVINFMEMILLSFYIVGEIETRK